MAFYDTVRAFHHKDGHRVWTHVAVSLLRDHEGEPLHLIAQIESLEGRQHGEENLAAERERLKITVQSIHDAVITTDASTCITYINTAAGAEKDLEATHSEYIKFTSKIGVPTLQRTSSESQPSAMAKSRVRQSRLYYLGGE